MANEFRVRKKLIVNGSGSVILDVQGSQGQLFSITDSLSGSLFSVKDISGIPVMEAFSDDTVNIGTFNAEAIKVSGSFARITGSLLGTASWANNAVTSSYALTAQTLLGSVVSASYAATASSADNFTVRGTLTAQTIVAQTITSSTDFVTGSTRFGSLLSNTHQFTGSVGITGSLTIDGTQLMSVVASQTTPVITIQQRIGGTNNGSSVSLLRYQNVDEYQAAQILGSWSSANVGGFIFNHPQGTGGGITFSFLPAINVISSTVATINQTFNPVGGSATNTQLLLSPIISQSSGATGITRGLYVNPTLTAAADWRSIEWSNNAATSPSASWGLYGSGTAPNFLSGSLGIGTNAPQRPLHIYSNSGMWIQSPTGGNSILVLTPTGIDTLNLNTIDFAITANSRMRLFSTGNLAIGSTSDSGERLQVSGSSRFAGNMTVTGSVSITGSLNAPVITGSLFGTASWAQNALTSSYILNAVSASFAATAALAPLYVLTSTTSSMLQPYVLTSQTSSMSVLSASYAITASYALNAGGATVNTGSFLVTASAVNTTITFTKGDGSTFNVTVSQSGSVATASYALYAESASNASNAINSQTASYVNPLCQVVTITGSLLVSGSTTQTGNNTLTGNTVLSGSVNISGSTTIFGTTIFRNTSTTITGSLLITGSTTQIGNNTLIGNTVLTGSIIMSGSENPSTPTIQIYGDTQFTGVTRFNPIGRTIDTSISASYIYVSGSTNDLYFSQNGSGYANTTRLRWLESGLYTGILNGGVISSSIGSTTWNISSGSGIIVTQNASTSSSPYPTVQYVTWDNLTNIPITNSGSAKLTYVGIDNTGTPVQQTVPWGSTDINQFDTQINLGVVLHLSGSVSTGVFSAPQISYGQPQKADDFFRAFGPLKISGHVLSPSGSSPTLSIIKTGGTAYKEGANYRFNANHPSTTVENAINTSKIYRYYISGSTPVIDTGVSAAGYTTIDNTQYVNTTTGNLATVGNSNWSIQRVFWIPNSPTNAFIVYYGNAKYSTLLNAVNAKDSEPFVEAPNTAINAIFLGYIIIEGGSGRDLLNADETTIIPGGLFRSVGGVGSSGTAPVPITLEGLSDVDAAGRVAGDLLYYNGSQWINSKTLVGNYSISGTLNVSSNVVANLTGTASLASTASFAPLYVLTSATSSMLAPYVLTSQTSSMSVLSASFAATAALAPNYVLTSATGSMLQPYVLTSVTSSMLAPYVLTSQTSSMSVKSAVTASYADNFTVAGTLTAQTIVVQTITSSVDFVTGSTRFGSIITNTHQFTGSVSVSGSLVVNGSAVVLSNQTGSMSVATASYVLNAVSASYAATASYANQFTIGSSQFNNTSSVTAAGTTTVSSLATGSYTSCFYNYTIASASNARSGQVMSVWNGTTVRYTEVTTTDIGNTATASFAVVLSGANVNLNFTAPGSWTVKSIANLL